MSTCCEIPRRSLFNQSIVLVVVSTLLIGTLLYALPDGLNQLSVIGQESFHLQTQTTLGSGSLAVSTLKDFDRIQESPKHLKLVFVVGLEGSGHHFWNSIFDKLSKHSVNKEIVCAEKRLGYCLLRCFDTSRWGNRLEEVFIEWMDKYLQNWKDIGDFCDCVMDELKRYTNTSILHDGSLLAIAVAISYPFSGLNIARYPDLELLIEMAQSLELAPYIFDVRLIVMKRDVATCLVSACVHRFGHCDERIQYAERGLSLIQTQLMAIDPQFWIMLDYDHLVTHLNDSRYVDIIAKWLSVDPVLMQQVTADITPSNTTVHQSQWNELQSYNSSQDLTKIVERVFYGNAASKWSFFNDPYFCVTPDNTQFVDSKVGV